MGIMVAALIPAGSLEMSNRAKDKAACSQLGRLFGITAGVFSRG